MTRLRNINPLGEVYVPILGRALTAGEVFEVTPEEAELLLLQASNWEVAEGATLTSPHPRGVPGYWPTPAWWGGRQGSRGWCLLRLRCLDCGKLAARFLVPESRQGLSAFPVPVAIQLGEWISTKPDGDLRLPTLRKRRQQNLVADPCSCDWSSGWPDVSDPGMREALRKALSSVKPPPAVVGTSTSFPARWLRLGRDQGTVLAARPGR